MQRIRVSLILTLLISSLLALLIVQAFQTAQLYDKKTTQFKEKFALTMEQIALKHERGEEMRRYMHTIDKDFSGKYKDILKEEFQELMSTDESISIRDTTIYEDGEPANYLIIQGRAYDSISGLTAEQRVLARDVRHLRDLFSNPQTLMDKDSMKMAIQLDQRVIHEIFKKARFVNELMLETFRTNVYEEPSERLDIHFLDTVIKTELKGKKLPGEFSFMITDSYNIPVEFEKKPDAYTMKLDTTGSHKSLLFPGNSLDDDLYLHMKFNKQGSFVLKEMGSALLVNFILVLIIVVALVIMFKTILTQKKLSEIKNNFISNMTHEFKTPISTISLACQAVADGDVVKSDPESTKTFMKMIEDENKRLEVLVERILQSAVIDRGELKIKEELLDLNSMLSEIINHAKFRVKNVGGEIHLELPDEIIAVAGDKVHITNVLSNLVDNAIKYSDGKPEVKISLQATNNEIKIAVTDKGIGIKKEHIHKIFDNLYRIPTGNIHNVKGFGLGLSYVKAIVELHGWNIHVKSKIGEGSTFTVIIDKKR
jgi:two-component system phosphate regulon sensor histidine kinase PhoR